jgi:hypothetical protein
VNLPSYGLTLNARVGRFKEPTISTCPHPAAHGHTTGVLGFGGDEEKAVCRLSFQPRAFFSGEVKLSSVSRVPQASFSDNQGFFGLRQPVVRDLRESSRCQILLWNTPRFDLLPQSLEDVRARSPPVLSREKTIKLNPAFIHSVAVMAAHFPKGGGLANCAI